VQKNVSLILKHFLKKKFDRALNRVTDTNQKNDYINKKKTIEETLSTLKSNLQSASKGNSSTGSNSIVQEQPKKLTKEKDNNKDNNKKDNKSGSVVISIEDEERDRKRREREKERALRDDAKLRKLEEGNQPKEVKEIIDIQKDTLSSLARSKGINEETLRIADQIAIKLAQQTEHMEQIQNKLNELGTGLTRAGKEVNTVMRGIATDKLLMLCICCIILIAFGLLIGRIIWYAVDKVQASFPTSTSGSSPSK